VIIDCDSCAVRGRACGDCVVSVLLGPPGTGSREPAHAGHARVDLNDPEQAAIAVLADSGLVPPLRLVSDDGEREGRTPRKPNPVAGLDDRRAAG